MLGKSYYQVEKDYRGQHYWRGEDARPYVCENYLFVADGLGGSGGFPHTGMNPLFLDHEFRMKTICHKLPARETVEVPAEETAGDTPEDIPDEAVTEADGDTDIKKAEEALKDAAEAAVTGTAAEAAETASEAVTEITAETAETVSETDGEAADEELDAYLRENFQELEKMKGYSDVPYQMLKHSGYYASRIVTGVLLDTLRNDESMSTDKLFEQITDTAEEEDVQKIIREYAEKLREIIRVRMEETAKAANFNMDDGDAKNNLLLPTTLSLALYRENADGTADVICLWAGDSRICALLSDGAVQLTIDEEKNTVMTNLISLSAPFSINARHYRFKTPFVLFAITDGCFDWAPSCLCLEYEVMLKPLLADNLEGAVKTWHDLFDGFGTKDDSSTVAFNAIGLPDFEAIHSFVEPRMTEIKEKYISQLPDLFDIDYDREYRERKNSLGRDLGEVQKVVLNDPAAITYAKTLELDNPSPEYLAALEEIDRKIKEAKESKAKLEEHLATAVRGRWFYLRPASGVFGKGMPVSAKTSEAVKGILSEIRETEAVIKEKSNQFRKFIADRKEQVDAVYNETSESLKKLSAYPLKGRVIVPEDAIREQLLELIRFYKDLVLPDIQDLASGKNEIQKAYTSESERNIKLQKKLLEYEEPVCEEMIRFLIKPELPEFASEWLPEYKAWIVERQKMIKDWQTEIERLEAERMGLAVEYAKKNAPKRFEQIMAQFAKRDYQELSPETQAFIQKTYLEKQKKLEEIETKSKIQTGIFRETDELHLRLIKEDKQDE